MRQLVQVQHTHHVADGGDAIDQPRVLVALHDLLFIRRAAHQVAHHRAHHVVQCDHAHHQAVLIDDDGEVLMHLPELLQHFRQREFVRHDEHLAHQAVVGQRDGLVVQHALEQVLCVHVAHYVVDVALADGVGRKRLGGNAQPDDGVGFVPQKERYPVAG